MMVYIPSEEQETVTIKRKVGTTRTTFTTVASNVKMHIQQNSGGLVMEDNIQYAANRFIGILTAKNTSIVENDVIERTGKTTLHVMSKLEFNAYQELVLSDEPRRGIL